MSVCMPLLTATATWQRHQLKTWHNDDDDDQDDDDHDEDEDDDGVECSTLTLWRVRERRRGVWSSQLNLVSGHHDLLSFLHYLCHHHDDSHDHLIFIIIPMTIITIIVIILWLCGSASWAWSHFCYHQSPSSLTWSLPWSWTWSKLWWRWRWLTS